MSGDSKGICVKASMKECSEKTHPEGFFLFLFCNFRVASALSRPKMQAYPGEHMHAITDEYSASSFVKDPLKEALKKSPSHVS